MASRVRRVMTAFSWSDPAGNNRNVSDPSSNDLDSSKVEEAYRGVVAVMQRSQNASLEELQGAVEYLLDAIVTQRRSKHSR